MPYGFLLTYRQRSNDMHKRTAAHLMRKWFGYYVNISSNGREEKMRKSFKYRLYPNKTTEKKLTEVLDRCRELYNACVQERRDAYTIRVKQHPNYYDPEWRKQATKEHHISQYDQQNELPEMKEIREEYQEIGSHVLQNVCKRVEDVFAGFFDRIKGGKTPGYPRFKGKNRYESFSYPDKAGWKMQGARLTLTKIGTARVKLHRPMEGKIKTCTIKREGEHWYVVFSCEVEASERLAYTDDAVGIDLGLLHFATLSTLDTRENPRIYRKTEKKLAKAQRSLAKKKRRSHRRARAVKRLARLHRKARNQRQDFLHKASRSLVDTFDTLVFEELAPSNLSRRPKPKQDENGKYLPNGAAAKGGLNKSVADAGWSEFVGMCTYKAAYAGRTVLQVNPKYTSQVCSGCGTVRKKALDERWHSCECGTELDRDHNAAINIKRLGRSQQAAHLRASGGSPVEAPAF